MSGLSGHGWQDLIIGVLVAVSAIYMARKLAPALSWRLQARFATWLIRRRAARWQTMGRKLLPPQASGGCGGGACDGCGDSGDAMPPLEQKVTFHRRKTHRQ